ncbi:hypothetical protein HU200_003249 [Digitaria exilis]|uniref:F-box domain-containing protein n=1 Tax=Digitaria exilis TaxID=1010633 RepID=A0A835FWI5_9POAL|nr:hypothetical protein HU200_003249 [Digitaria exilis]
MATGKGDHTAAPPPPFANAGVLPVDILPEVLLRLPADELCRLRLVCRSWRSLTSNKLFAKEHSSCHRYVLALHSMEPHEIHVLDMHGNIVKKIRLATGYGDVDRSSQLDLVPIIGSSSSSPTQVLDLATGAAVVLRGVSDVITSCQKARGPTFPRYLLGQVSSTREYKMLCVVHSYAQGYVSLVQSCHVMTLGDTTWRVAPQPPITLASVSWKMVGVDGVAFFLGSEHCVGIEVDSVAMFDFGTEEWRPNTLIGPLTSLVDSTGHHNLIYHGNRLHLSQLRGCLVMVHKNDQDSSTDLWFLEDINKSLWTKRYSMPWPPYWKLPGFIYPKLVLQNGKIVVWMPIARILRAYDPRTSTWTDMATLKDYCRVCVHNGSLLCS